VSLPLTLLWLVGCANAFNLIDGVDGLATGLGLFATLTMVIAALLHGNLTLAIATAPLAGALLGFLRYNFNPASIFLGDSGSLLVGFLLGCYGVLWTQKSATLLGMAAPLMALSIPILDVCLSIGRRFLSQSPIFGADRGHIHHRLLDRGLSPRRVALLLYAVGGLGALFSILQSVVPSRLSLLILALFCASTWIFVHSLKYVEFGVAGRSCWSVHIPVSDSDYVTCAREVGCTLETTGIACFADLLGSALRGKLLRPSYSIDPQIAALVGRVQAAASGGGYGVKTIRETPAATYLWPSVE